MSKANFNKLMCKGLRKRYNEGYHLTEDLLQEVIVEAEEKFKKDKLDGVLHEPDSITLPSKFIYGVLKRMGLDHWKAEYVLTKDCKRKYMHKLI